MFRAITVSLILSGMIFSGFSYDKEKAVSLEKFYSAFNDANVKKALQKICPEKMLKRMELGEEFFFVDMRTEGERKLMGITLDNVLSVSMDKVLSESTLAKLPTDKIIVIVCASGVRAVATAMALRQIGFKKTFILSGGLKKLMTNIGPK